MQSESTFGGLEALEARTFLSAVVAGDAPQADTSVAARHVVATRAKKPKLPKAFAGVFTLAVSGTDALLGPFAFTGTFTVRTKGTDYLVTDQLGNSLSGTIVRWTITKVTAKAVKVTATSVGVANVQGVQRNFDLSFAGKFKNVAAGKKFNAQVTGKEQVSGLPINAAFVATLV